MLGELTQRLTRDAVTVDPVPRPANGDPRPVPAYRALAIVGDTAGVPRRLRSGLVGRRPQLAALGGLYRACRQSGRPQIAALVGEPGAGKTRLAHEFVQSAADATILHGRCHSYGEAITYAPLAAGDPTARRGHCRRDPGRASPSGSARWYRPIRARPSSSPSPPASARSRPRPRSSRGPPGRCSRRLPAPGPSWSCSTTCSGPSRCSSTCSAASVPSRRRCSCSAWLAPRSPSSPPGAISRAGARSSPSSV